MSFYGKHGLNFYTQNKASDFEIFLRHALLIVSPADGHESLESRGRYRKQGLGRHAHYALNVDPLVIVFLQWGVIDLLGRLNDLHPDRRLRSD